MGGENTSDSERGASEVAEHPVGLGQTQTATCTIFLKRRKPLRGVLKHSVNHLSYLTLLFRALNLPPAPFYTRRLLKLLRRIAALIVVCPLLLKSILWLA